MWKRIFASAFFRWCKSNYEGGSLLTRRKTASKNVFLNTVQGECIYNEVLSNLISSREHLYYKLLCTVLFRCEAFFLRLLELWLNGITKRDQRRKRRSQNRTHASRQRRWRQQPEDLLGWHHEASNDQSISAWCSTWAITRSEGSSCWCIQQGSALSQSRKC